ncbi:MAG: hypothetical protein CXT66_06285 [Methanobacteriota archaeon]|jgi:hypothetical protein|nr:MAG: hypothetical protein CXT66_06285 [Euryarchaeota archaeon]HIL68219.1 hypothetical protein [Candidatus Poseidoniales archaeon]
MEWKKTLLTGAAAGASVGFFGSLNGFFDIGYGSFGGFLASIIAFILLSAFGVKIISKKTGFCDPSLKHLIPVSFLTFVIPVFGPALGAGSTGPEYVGALIVFGAVGGLFWSTPFVGWSYYKSV